jgi:hypothetical protein
MVRYAVEKRVFVYDVYLKYGSARKRWRKFGRKFPNETVPSRETNKKLVNKLTSMGLLIDKEEKQAPSAC